MVLQVDFANLAEEAKRHNLKPWAYVSVIDGKCVVTIGGTGNVMVSSESDHTFEQAEAELSKQGLLVGRGRIVPDPLAGEIQIEEQLWVASVAYRSSERRPGLWVGSFRGEPSVGTVLREFYEEMASECGLQDVSLEAFISGVDPNVVVMSPDQLAAVCSSAD